MKKVLLLSTIALIALCSSCKKDTPTPQELILGKWKITKLIIDDEDVTIPEPQYITEIEVDFVNENTLLFSLKETDTSFSPPEIYSESYTGSYSINGNQITVSLPSEGLSITGNLEVTETRLVIVSTSGDIVDFFSLLEADKI